MSALLWALIAWGALKLLALLTFAANGLPPSTPGSRVFSMAADVAFGVWALCLMVKGPV